MPVNWRREHKAGRSKVPRILSMVSSTRGSMWWHWEQRREGRGWHLVGTERGDPPGSQLGSWICGDGVQW